MAPDENRTATLGGITHSPITRLTWINLLTR
jgi:hypothetical protein